MKAQALGFTLFLCVLSTAATAWAQIINIQPSLIVTEENGLSGEVDAAGDWNTGNLTKIAIAGKLSTRYRYDKHHLYLMASGRYIALSENPFEKNLAEHLRYRYEWTDWFAPEVYGQHEYNDFRRLLVRLLAGIGPRFTPYRSEVFYVALGTSYMLEYEKLNDSAGEDGNPLADASASELNHRWSNYLSLNLVLEERLQLASTTYYQPKFNDFSDFRVLSELAFVVQIVGTFSVKISAAIAYDRQPPLTVKRFDSYLGFGLSLAFGPGLTEKPVAPEPAAPEPAAPEPAAPKPAALEPATPTP